MAARSISNQRSHLANCTLDQFSIVRGGTSNLNVNLGEMFLTRVAGEMICGGRSGASNKHC